MQAVLTYHQLLNAKVIALHETGRANGLTEAEEKKLRELTALRDLLHEAFGEKLPHVDAEKAMKGLLL